MASVAKSGNRWKAESRRGDFYESARFDTEVQAKAWGIEADARLARRAERVKRGHDAAPVLRLCSEAEILGSSLAAARLSGIYFLIEENEVIYVGKSTDAYTRVADHRARGRKFSRFTVLPCPESQLHEVESAYIAVLQPEGNTAQNGKRLAHIKGEVKSARNTRESTTKLINSSTGAAL